MNLKRDIPRLANWSHEYCYVIVHPPKRKTDQRYLKKATNQLTKRGWAVYHSNDDQLYVKLSSRMCWINSEANYRSGPKRLDTQLSPLEEWLKKHG